MNYGQGAGSELLHGLESCHLSFLFVSVPLGVTAKCSVLLWQLICFMGHPVSPQAPDYEHRGGSSCAGIQRHQSPFTSHLSFLQGGALKFRGLFSSRVSKLLVADTLVPSPWSDALRSTLCLLHHMNIILRGYQNVTLAAS